MRTLLRLEDLYERVDFFLERDDPARAPRRASPSLFEILEVASRADLKTDLLQELDRQRTFLEALRDNPAISEASLERRARRDRSRRRQACTQTSGKTGQELRENEWLMGIKQRTAIPGGTCEFDLPSYHYWLHQDADAPPRDLERWLDAVPADP